MAVDFDLDGLSALRPANVSKAVLRTLRKAGSTALRDMRAETSKRVRQRKRIKASVVRRALRLTRAKGSRIEDLEWSLDIADTPMRVADYPHRQTRRGVSVAINRGQRSLLRSAFIASLPSGHKGVFVRRGAKRLPIAEQFASRVLDAVSHPGEAEAIHRRGQVSFVSTFNRLLYAELAKGKRV